MSNIFTYIFNLQANNNKVIAQFNGVREGVMTVRTGMDKKERKKQGSDLLLIEIKQNEKQ